MAKGQFLVASLILLISISLVGLLGVGSISADPQGNGASRIISVLGIAQVQGQPVFVDILVQVQPGQNANEVAREALQSQGARPFDSANLGSEGFTLIGSVWDSFPVIQNYNPGSPSTQDEPLDALSALTSSHATWNAVSTSEFDINFGALTTNCPSLITKCPGPRFFDDSNDVGWLKLRRGILGVASFTGQEADMALSTSFNWSVGCIPNTIDVETVFLHELGHVVGLRHSDDTGSVMLKNYHGADCDLGTDDEEGATFLYDNNIQGSVSGTVKDTSNAPISGATVVLEGTLLNDITIADGSYTISLVPDPVTYDVTASKDDVSFTVFRETVGSVGNTVNFILDIGDGGNGGGGKCPPQSKSKKCP